MPGKLGQRRKNRRNNTGGTNMAPINMEQLVAEEMARCEAFLKSQQVPIKSPPRLPLHKFVERSIMLHRRLLERWGGWEYHGPATVTQDTSMARQFFQSELERLNRRLYDLSHTYPDQFPYHLAVNPMLHSREEGNIIGEQCLVERVLPFTFEGYTLDPEKTYTLKLASYLGKGPKGGMTKSTWLEGKIRVGQRIAQVISRALEEGDFEESYPQVFKEFETFLQRLGENVWSGKEYPTALSLTCRPSAFLQLGHYGERNSCYQNGGQYDCSKMFLAADLPDSFVLKAYRSDSAKNALSKQEKDIGLSGRAWGIAIPDAGALITNFYMMSKESLLSAVTKVLEGGLGVRSPTILGETPWRDLRSLGSPQERTAVSAYINLDCTLIGGKTAFRQSFVRHYLAKVTEYSSVFGVYTHRGTGPQFQITGNGGRELSRLQPPKLWPYEDCILRDMLKEGGLYI